MLVYCNVTGLNTNASDPRPAPEPAPVVVPPLAYQTQGAVTGAEIRDFYGGSHQRLW